MYCNLRGMDQLSIIYFKVSEKSGRGPNSQISSRNISKLNAEHNTKLGTPNRGYTISVIHRFRKGL